MSEDARLPPPALGVRLAADVLVRDGGRLLCGGAPFRLVRLSATGAAVAARWRRGGPVGDAPACRALARRLLDAGMLLTAPGTPADVGGMEIVVPARDRPAELGRCLAALAERAPTARLVVVDDGSRRPGDIARIASAHGASVVRHDVSRGPAAARNAGLAATTGPLVAFVDSDVVVEAGCLERLAAHFDDPTVGAAAPRVLALHEPDTWLGRYEAERSSLDLGPRPASVGPGRPVPYVPSTTLVVRRDAVPAGFDEALDVGEDVDVVWRMVAAGWRVAYDPAAAVRHDHRLRPGAFWRRRWDYARSIGPLARRHPAALPAVHAEPWSTGILLLILARRPFAAAAALLARLAVMRRRVAGRTDRPTALAAELLALGLKGTAGGLGHAARRAWSPPLLLLAPRSRAARTALAAAVALDVVDDRRHARRLPLSLADDLVAALATWAGCLRARTARPLLPARYRPR